MDYYFSFSSTFHSFMEGKVGLDDLRNGHFLLGWDRNVLLSGEHAPGRLTQYNKVKPNVSGQANFVQPADLDPEVLAKWEEFRRLLAERDETGAVIWNKTGQNYTFKCYEFLRAGNRVFWNGEWQQLKHYSWVGE